jgi:hypothetical protein
MDKEANKKNDTKIHPKNTNKHKHRCCTNCEKPFAKLHAHPIENGGLLCDECRNIVWSWLC